ncbi:MAG: hypothetical protein ACD_56C00093G0002 [uncultured bacterium]|nr:MAG: hypothetical protein ACD_56C00093G0002 [uncultured bacterium]
MQFIGNKKISSILNVSLKKGVLNHAYIFSGPERVGKFTLARMFALGAIGGGEFDLDVDVADKDALLDLIVVKPEIVEKNKVSKQRDIAIDSIREAKLKLSLFPYRGKYKILIVDDAHRLNVSAQNALLKILEEPNPTTIIILVTHEIDRILATLLSRSQVVNFSLASDREILENENFRDVAALSIGRPGLARLLLDNEDEKNFRQQAHGQFEKVITGSMNERFTLAEEYSKDIVKTLEKLNIWIWEMRKKALSGAENEWVSAYERIEKIQNVLSILKRTNSNARLILETLFMDM